MELGGGAEAAIPDFLKTIIIGLARLTRCRQCAARNYIFCPEVRRVKLAILQPSVIPARVCSQ